MAADALGLPAAGIGRLRHELNVRGSSGLAKAVAQLHQARRWAAHPCAGLAAEVCKVLEMHFVVKIEDCDLAGSVASDSGEAGWLGSNDSVQGMVCGTAPSRVITRCGTAPIPLLPVGVDETMKSAHVMGHTVANDVFIDKKYEKSCPSLPGWDVLFVRHIENQLPLADPVLCEVSLLTESGNLHLGSVKADLISVGDHVWLMDEQADEYEMTEDERLGIILDVEPRDCPGGLPCRFGSEVLAFLSGEIELLSVHGRVDGRRRDLG